MTVPVGARLLTLVLIPALWLAGCAPSGSAAPSDRALRGELTVFAASSLTESFREIAQLFEQAYPGTTIVFNVGGSPQLRTQLEQGARSDVFASANAEQMDLAIRSGLVAPGSAKTFARNKLTVVTPKDNPAKISTPADLAKPGLKLVLAQSNVPVGGYARDALRKMAADPAYGSNFLDRVLKNLVSEETNVRQVLVKVQLGEADAAIVYTTDVTPDAAAAVQQVPIPDAFNSIATYPLARLRDSRHADLAEAFVAYVLSPQGQAVLQKWGFLPPG